jgi:hypothetical protein
LEIFLQGQQSFLQLLWVFNWQKNGNFSHIVLDMDAKEVIVFLNSDEDCWSIDGALVDSIKTLFNYFL